MKLCIALCSSITAAGALAATLPPRAALPEAASRLFAARTWLAAPLPITPVSAPAPAAPVAPPLPFSFLGKFRPDGGVWTVYLARGDDVLSVASGEAIGETYRFDGIEDGRLVFEYLPLSVRQTLPIGAEQERP